jgi:hypothetical protein
VLLTDPPLAIPSPPSQLHDIATILQPSAPHSQAIPIEPNLSFEPPGLSLSSLSQSPQDPRFSPRTPEQEASFKRSTHEADFEPTKQNPTSSNHESFHQHLGSQTDPYNPQRITFFPYQGPQLQIRPLIQVPSQQKASISRRRRNEQFKCTSCYKVFPRRCDLKYAPSYPRLEI